MRYYKGLKKLNLIVKILRVIKPTAPVLKKFRLTETVEL